MYNPSSDRAGTTTTYYHYVLLLRTIIYYYHTKKPLLLLLLLLRLIASTTTPSTKTTATTTMTTTATTRTTLQLPLELQLLLVPLLLPLLLCYCCDGRKELGLGGVRRVTGSWVSRSALAMRPRPQDEDPRQVAQSRRKSKSENWGCPPAGPQLQNSCCYESPRSTYACWYQSSGDLLGAFLCLVLCLDSGSSQ